LDKEHFRILLKDRILLLDGATGTELQKKGMPSGVSPEKWVLENPDALISLQRDYFQAGSRAVLSFTFGGNRLKLDEYGLGDAAREINRSLVKVSRQAAGKDGLVAGDISATGRFVQPFGDLPFEAAVNIYKEQVAGLIEGGVDFFIIETMIDLQEARAALLAVKESCDLPVCVSITFNEDGRTLTGTDPVSALITLQALGADAVGCNCSTGPQNMLEFVRAMRPFAKVPLLAKPNAGLPKLIDGETVFDMGLDEFGKYGPLLIEAGVTLLGGCCGTSPSYIASIASNTKGIKPLAKAQPIFSAVTSIRKTVQIGPEFPVTIIGERINPTGKKTLPEELRQGKTTEVRRLAMEQAAGGAQILDVNVGMPGISEAKKMTEVVEVLATYVETPLCLDSSSPGVIEAALRIYPGRALINSISAEKSKLEKLLPVAAKYGAMFILLPLDDEGIPKTALEREALVEKVCEIASGYGYSKQDIIVDGLVMTVSADQEAAKETLKLIRWCSQEFKVNTLAGLSNVSFGLPDRGIINNAFLAMAIGNGATAVIANPGSEGLMPIKMASDVLTGKDKNSTKFIASRTARVKPSRNAKGSTESRGLLEQIFDSVLSGDREVIAMLLQKAMAEGYKPNSLMNEQLIPAIARSGELFDKGEYFLPQLIQSAEAMKAAVEVLEPFLKTGSEDASPKTTIVLATVKGDIHDIGKNIVALMLRNYGFNVLDLGKDVDASLIVNKTKETGAEIIGLSALMTTTMVQMKTVIDMAKVEGLRCRFLVGGAVVNQAYADEIGADAYAADAQAAVKIARGWSSM
jgi:5-methyltetrahydrofolate--homocysteine methyltransferase